MLLKQLIFQNTMIDVEPIADPATGEVGGYAIALVDQDSGDVYRYPMSKETAKKIGSRLMGLGNVEVVGANGSSLSDEFKDELKRTMREGKGT